MEKPIMDIIVVKYIGADNKEYCKPNNPYFKGYFEQNVALNKALEVIDKYKAESEEKEWKAIL